MTQEELDGATAMAPEGVEITDPGQFAARWNSLDPGGRERWVTVLRENSAKATTCFLRDHDRAVELLAEARIVEDARRTALHYRSAWFGLMFKRFPWLRALLRPSTVDFSSLASEHVTRLSARDVELVEAALDAPAEPDPALRRWVSGRF